ncbi:hypothetical protein JOM56_015182 [Amanita muscaria]
MLPTPHPNHQIDPERRSTSPALVHQHVPPGVQTHYPRPTHNSPPRVLDKYQGDWEITDQLMEQFQFGNLAVPCRTTSAASFASYELEETVSPPKDPVERVRIAEQRASPNDLTSQRRRESQTAARESPKTRDAHNLQLPHIYSPKSFLHRGSPYHAGDYTSPDIPHDPPQPPSRGIQSHKALFSSNL